MIIILVIFYAVVFYPMRKKQKQHADMLGNLKNGDRVITNGGLYGTIAGMTDDTLQLRVADNVKVQVARSAVAGLQPPPQLTGDTIGKRAHERARDRDLAGVGGRIGWRSRVQFRHPGFALKSRKQGAPRPPLRCNTCIICVSTVQGTPRIPRFSLHPRGSSPNLARLARGKGVDTWAVWL